MVLLVLLLVVVGGLALLLWIIRQFTGQPEQRRIQELEARVQQLESQRHGDKVRG